MRHLTLFITIGLIMTLLTGCAIGVLLFYKDIKKRSVYRSSKSKKDYFIITAYVLNNCGCTHLFIENYKEGQKTFDFKYYDNVARKYIYQYDPATKIKDTIKLQATESNNFSIAFDTLDKQILMQIDTIIMYPQKGMYPIQKHNYKGFVSSIY